MQQEERTRYGERRYSEAGGGGTTGRSENGRIETTGRRSEAGRIGTTRRSENGRIGTTGRRSEAGGIGATGRRSEAGGIGTTGRSETGRSGATRRSEAGGMLDYEKEIMIEREERRRRLAQIRRRQEMRRRKRIIRMAVIVTGVAIMMTAVVGIHQLLNREEPVEEVMVTEVKYINQAPDYRVDLLEINEYSRPGTPLEQVNGIVIHYTANPGTTAAQNRSYFDGLKDTGETYASSHFIIGIEGEIIQCIPANEIAYASKDRNADTISIECCIPDETGKFADATYQSLIELVTWLMGRYELSAEDVIRHYDVTGKACPKYYVENEEEWLQFRQDILTYIETYGIAKSEEIK